MWYVCHYEYSKDNSIGYAEVETINKDNENVWISLMYRIFYDEHRLAIEFYYPYDIDDNDKEEIEKVLIDELKEEGILED